jgi:putative SOS response-associated peptidase YedK
MCYYNRLLVPVEHRFDLGDLEIILPDQILLDKPLQSGFEYEEWPIIIWSDASQKAELIKAHWEFLAPWCRSMKAVEAGRQKYTTLNAIGENLFDSKLYKEAAMKRRCLVLSSGFYEWRHFKPEGAKKELNFPYFISIKDQPVFYMAGIWQPWTDLETGELINSFAIVTTTANSLMEQVHNKKKRMPVVLTDELAEKWLKPGLDQEAVAAIAGFKMDPGRMSAITLHKDFRTAADPIDRFEYYELPEIHN